MTDRPWEPTATGTDIPDTPAALRADTPALSDRIYLNWGASGPSPRTVLQAVEAAIENHEFEAPTTNGMYAAADEIFDATRDRIADFLGATPAEIALVQSTTAGINRVATAIDWQPGDVVVTTDLEHAAGRLPWTRLEKAVGLEIRVLETENGVIDLETLDAALSGADLLCVSAIDWLYGRVHPVSEMVELAHENDALALVDAVQVPGQQPITISDWDADFVAGAGHKWLLGPWGAGFLYVSEDVVGDVEPIHVGYRSVSEAVGGTYELHRDARRFEIGTMNPAPFAGLLAAIDTINSVGQGAIQERIRSLRHRFVDQVSPDRLLSPADSQSGLITIQVDDPESAIERLDAAAISARSLPLTESIRLSVHALNTEADIDAVLAELHDK